jgi:inner membrane protein
LDNLTHSLAGALLGRMGLKRATGRAMPTLIISANLPDIDSFIARPLGLDPIAFHRGFTHGIGGWIVMPFVTAALILAWNRWRPAKEPVRPLAVLLLAAIGTLSHPLLDLMNTYGVQLFEPLKTGWVYGDTLFIVDPWIWIACIFGLELSWRAERHGRDWTRPALAMFALVSAYVAGNAAISWRAESLAKERLLAGGLSPTNVVASPLPITSWQRRVIWRNAEVGGSAFYDPFSGGGVLFDRTAIPLNLDKVPPRQAQSDEVRSFLYWSRMPLVLERDGRLYLTDQRYMAPRGSRRSGPFLVPLESKR